MRLFAKCKSAMSMVVALCLLITNVEAAAFAQAPQSSAPPASAAPENQNPQQSAQSAQTGQSEAKPRSGRRKLKWILIGVAVIGGVAAAILVKNKKGPEPVVTVDGPSIGSPQ
jgi:hypothetical protein